MVEDAGAALLLRAVQKVLPVIMKRFTDRQRQFYHAPPDFSSAGEVDFIVLLLGDLPGCGSCL